MYSSNHLFQQSVSCRSTSIVTSQTYLSNKETSGLNINFFFYSMYLVLHCSFLEYYYLYMLIVFTASDSASLYAYNITGDYLKVITENQPTTEL